MDFNILGVDISNNNSITDLSTLANNNVDYMYLKATEGQSFKDKISPSRYSQGKSLGLKIGFYHFLVGTSSPEDQALSFYNYIKDYESDLIPMLDIERNFSNLCNYVIRFINKFNELSNLELGIYTYSSFVEYLNPISSVIKARKCWIANYCSSYSKVNTGFFSNICGWQYSENGNIGSFTGDCNYFNELCLANNSKHGEWILNNVGWWYKFDDGTYPANEWYKIDGKWYLFNSEGYMLYGWQWSDGGNWYYLGNKDDGSMKTGWIFTDGKWYFFDDNGAMKIGWYSIQGKWYFFNNDGSMQTGWLEKDGFAYLLYSDGSMACNTECYGYSFDCNGHATKL